MNKVFLIAGEPSGDALGGSLMAAMKRQQPDIMFDGVGGMLMQAQGLDSFVPMEDLCVMGLAEVVKHYPRLRRLGFRIIEHIEAAQPNVVVTIDLPDFNFAVAKRLKKRGIYRGKIVHYVAPSVWAWRPGRAKKVAQFLDGLMCLFPFEPDYFNIHGLRSEFVGHPMVESKMLAVNGISFRQRHRIEKDESVIGVLFGSRMSEVDKHGAIFRDTLKQISKSKEERRESPHVVVPTLPKLENKVRRFMDEAGLTYTMTVDADEKYEAFAACNAAMAVSGTVGLELAYMGIPHVACYKAHPWTAMLVRLLIKTKFVHLANILLGRAVIPELLQADCHAQNIAVALNDILDDPQFQKEGLQEVQKALGVGHVPSKKAAEFVLALL